VQQLAEEEKRKKKQPVASHKKTNLVVIWEAKEEKRGWVRLLFLCTLSISLPTQPSSKTKQNK